MGFADYIIIAVLTLILGLAGLYVYKAKKSGKKCIGCPDADTCALKKEHGCCCGDKSEK